MRRWLAAAGGLCRNTTPPMPPNAGPPKIALTMPYGTPFVALLAPPAASAGSLKMLGASSTGWWRLRPEQRPGRSW